MKTKLLIGKRLVLVLVFSLFISSFSMPIYAEETNDESKETKLIAEMSLEQYTEYLQENKEEFIDQYRETENYIALESNKRDIYVISFDDSISFENDSLKVLCSISTKQAIVINGINNNLFPTFDDRDTAFANL